MTSLDTADGRQRRALIAPYSRTLDRVVGVAPVLGVWAIAMMSG